MANLRNSSIELLRIVAILLIVMMHSAGYGIASADTGTRIGVIAINSAGNMGVTIFILISGYFGIHFRPSKLIKLWAMMLVYSVGIFIFDIIQGNIDFSAGGLYKAVTPVTSVKWWFMTCYIILFCLSPLVNRIVNTLTQSEMLWLLGVLAFFFVISPTILRHTITDDNFGKGLPNFFLAYLIGQYIRKYELPEKVERHATTIFVVCVLLLFGISSGLTFSGEETQPLLCRDNDLFIIVGAISLFIAFKNKLFHNRTVNYCAGFAFPIYLINIPILKMLHTQYTFSGNRIEWAAYIASFIEIVAIAVVAELVRRVIFDKPVEWAGRIADKKFTSAK